MYSIPEDFEWPLPWVSINDRTGPYQSIRVFVEPVQEAERADHLVRELHDEVCDGHPLANRRVQVVALSIADPNEFIYVTDDSLAPIAWVHLTWQQESSPNVPWCMLFRSLDAFEAWMHHHADDTG